MDGDIHDAWRAGRDYVIREHSVEEGLEIIERWTAIIQQTNPTYGEGVTIETEVPWNDINAFERRTVVGFGRWGGISEDVADVVKRFGQVFAFAYDRFRELKEKEERAREAEQQAAVDRMRAEATAMESTEDIANVVKTLWEGLVAQGLDFTTLVFRVEDRQADELQMYLVIDTGAYDFTLPEEKLVSRDMLESVNLYRSTMPLANTRAERTRGSYSGQSEGVKSDFRELWGFELPADVEESVQRVSVPFDFGMIGVVRTGDPFVEADLALVEPFAEGVSLGFTRYFDFQALEARNRELAIEAAVERVQNEASSMTKTDDLMRVVAVMFRELEVIGGERLWLSTIFLHEETDQYVWYMGQPHGNRFGYAEGRSWMWALDDSTEAQLVRREKLSERQDWAVSLWREGREQVRSHELKEEFLQRELTRISGLTELTEEEKAYFLGTVHSVGFPFDVGIIDLAQSREVTAEDIEIVGRFRDALALGFRRFLDFQQMERQNRALVIEAAVERVRAEATAMRSADSITNLLMALSEGFEAAGVSVPTILIDLKDEATDRLTVQLYARTDIDFPPDKILAKQGDAIIARTEVALSPHVAHGWPIGIGEPMLLGGYEDEAQLADLAEMWGIQADREALPTSRIYVPFDYGELSVQRFSDEPPFTEEDLSTVAEFADAVSLGYARYLDFLALEEANEKIQEATRLKSQFLATMSHELRTPMNAIIGFTRLVTRRRAENLTDRQRENLEKVQLSADHLLNLINEILDLSKVEAGRVEIEPSTFEVAPLVQGACDTVGPTLGKAGVEVICDVEDDVGEAYTDDARLRQIVINLLSNALKFTDQGEVRVGVRREKGEGRRGGGSSTASDVVIAVSDTGIGIPEEELGNIFEEFRQVDGTSTRRHQGTGLGLAITKKLVELLGGEIEVASEVGVGSTFTFRIPSHFGETLARGQGAGGTGVEALSPSTVHRPRSTDIAPSIEREAPGSRIPAPGSRTIVSIDDDPNVAVLLRQELADDGYQVISALNADDGVALVKKHRPSAVTVDILMPGKDGWETIKMLKDDPETRDIPIIVLSGIDNRELGFSMGVKDYLVKPIEREALLDVLGRVADGSVRDVLVVDDEPVAAELMMRILEEEGMASRRAANGQEALDRIAERIPDAILLDLMMPEMDGFEVVSRLQEDPAWKDIPVIVVTAKDLAADERKFLAEHVAKVVQKGNLDPAGLGETIREIVGKS